MKIKALLISMTILGALLFASPCLAADAEYWVYCVKGKGMVIDTRNLTQYSYETGTYPTDVRIMLKFSNQKDAETFARDQKSACKS